MYGCYHSLWWDKRVGRWRIRGRTLHLAAYWLVRQDSLACYCFDLVSWFANILNRICLKRLALHSEVKCFQVDLFRISGIRGEGYGGGGVEWWVSDCMDKCSPFWLLFSDYYYMFQGNSNKVLFLYIYLIHLSLPFFSFTSLAHDNQSNFFCSIIHFHKSFLLTDHNSNFIWIRFD